jgi:hypothetical protein
MIPGEKTINNSESPAETHKRLGWAKAFQEMADNGDDQLVIPDFFEDEDLEDWI